MYLSWTDDVLVVYPPYTCAGNAPDREPRGPLVAAVSEVPGWLTLIWLKESGAICTVCATGQALDQDPGYGHRKCHREPGNWTDVPAD
jgi:hypothetical protein